MGKLISITFAVLAFVSAANADDQVLTREQRMNEIRSLHWISEGSVALPDSKGSISLPSDYAAVVGAEGQRLWFLTEGTIRSKVEAIVVNKTNLDEVVFEYFDEGFVNAGDWSDLDPQAMLGTLKENTAQANLERQKQNLDILSIDGWQQAPTFDQASTTAYWAVSAHTGSAKIVNAIALRLGRYGYEKLTWIGSSDRYRPTGGDFDKVLAAHSFAPGASYSDHMSTDKVAGYGLASLVALVAGAKLAKVAGAGALILLLKKFGVVALAAVAGAFAWIRRKFSARPKA